MVPQSRTSNIVKWTDTGLTVLGDHRKYRVLAYVVVEQVGTVADDKNLRVIGGIAKTIDEHSRRGRMQIGPAIRNQWRAGHRKNRPRARKFNQDKGLRR